MNVAELIKRCLEKDKDAWDTADIGDDFPDPALADLDGDGDYDMIVGRQDGSSKGYENTGSATSPTWTTNTGWNIPDVFSADARSSPALADLDNDGDVDAMVGEYADALVEGFINNDTKTSLAFTGEGLRFDDDTVQSSAVGEGALVYSANESTTRVTYHDIVMESERYDPAGLHGTGSTITIATDGVYLATGETEWPWNTTGTRITWLQLGAGNYQYRVQQEGVAGDQIAQITSGLWDLNAGDTVELTAYQGSAGNLNVKGYLGIVKISGPGGGADLAEYYPTNEDPASLIPGTLISMDPENSTFIKKTAVSYDRYLLGVVPTKPGMILGADTQGDRQLIALAGRVPTLVTLEGGPIRAGEYITSSTIPGYGRKINFYHGGPSVGVALETFDPEENRGEVIPCPEGYEDQTCGRMMMYVNTGVVDPQIFLTDVGNLDIVKEPDS